MAHFSQKFKLAFLVVHEMCLELCRCIKTNLGLFFHFFENDLDLFWVYHFGNFQEKKNQEKWGQFHFLPRVPETHATPLGYSLYDVHVTGEELLLYFNAQLRMMFSLYTGPIVICVFHYSVCHQLRSDHWNVYCFMGKCGQTDAVQSLFSNFYFFLAFYVIFCLSMVQAMEIFMIT